MPTFYDALTGKQRPLNQKIREPSVEKSVGWCTGLDHGHKWDNEADDQCKCSVCGVSVVFVKALKNLPTMTLGENMSEQCNSTGTWFDVEWILRQLTYAEKWANDRYDTKLEAAIVKNIGLTLPVKGWKGLILRRKYVTTREDATRVVMEGDDFDGLWYPIEYSIRTQRDKFLDAVKSLRQAATTAQKADIGQLFVSKSDMVYLS